MVSSLRRSAVRRPSISSRREKRFRERMGIGSLIRENSGQRHQRRQDHNHIPSTRPIIDSVTYSPDGQLLATTSKGAGAKLWRASDGNHIRSLEEARQVIEPWRIE